MDGPPGFREPSIVQRFVGAVLDGFVLMPLAAISLAVDDEWAAVVVPLLGAAYQVGMHARDGQTLGKKAMGTRVVHQDTGEQISLGQAVVRWAIFLLGTLAAWALDWDGADALWALLVLLPVLRPPLHQGLHDLAAKTVVTSLR